jgi:hypothetical protein
VTGDLAFQVMALGKELMAGWWCMLCKLPRSKFMDNNREMWTMDKYGRCGLIAKNNNDESQLRVKKETMVALYTTHQLCDPPPSL